MVRCFRRTIWRLSNGVALAVALLLAATLSAQQPTFRSGTQVVSLFTTVLDAENHLVPDLAQTDFEVLDNDKPPVGAFNDKIELNAGFSNNRDKLISQVKDLDFGNGTRLFDAINESLD